MQHLRAACRSTGDNFFFMTHPIYVASEIAEWIRSDPVAALQIKNFILPEELVNRLDLAPEIVGADFSELTYKEKMDLLNQLPDIFTARELRDAAARA